MHCEINFSLQLLPNIAHFVLINITCYVLISIQEQKSVLAFMWYILNTIWITRTDVITLFNTKFYNNSFWESPGVCCLPKDNLQSERQTDIHLRWRTKVLSDFNMSELCWEQVLNDTFLITCKYESNTRASFLALVCVCESSWVSLWELQLSQCGKMLFVCLVYRIHLDIGQAILEHCTS